MMVRTKIVMNLVEDGGQVVGKVVSIGSVGGRRGETGGLNLERR